MRPQEDVRQPQQDRANGEEEKRSWAGQKNLSVGARKTLSDMLKSVLEKRTKSWICFWLCRPRSVRVRGISISLRMTVAVWRVRSAVLCLKGISVLILTMVVLAWRHQTW